MAKTSSKTSPKPTLSPPFWPTCGGPGNRRLLERPAPSELTVEWRIAFKGQIGTPVIGGDGTIYVGGFDKHLYAFSPRGELVFKKKLIGLVMSDIAIGPTGLVFVAPHHRPSTGLETMLCAVDPTRPKNDEIVWSATFPGATWPLRPHPDGGVIAVSSAGVVYSYDAAGTQRFATKFAEAAWSGASLLGDGTIVVIADATKNAFRVVGLAPDGTQRFAVPVPTTMAQPTVLADGGFWLLSTDSSRRRFDADGRVVAELTDPLTAGTFFQSGLTVTPDGSLWAAKNQRSGGALFHLDPTGAVRGHIDRSDGVGAPLSFADGAALVAVQDGTVVLVTADCEIAWSVTVGEPVSEAAGTTAPPVIPRPDGFVTRVDKRTSGNSDREPCELVGLA